MKTRDFETDIHSAIRALYDIFRPYRVSFPLEACDHCVDETRQRELAHKPLEQLSSEDLSYYSSKAMTTFGSVHDFKHFLPRIFELITCDRHFPHNPETVFGKLSYASWRDWPPMEQRAVERFLRAMWRYVLETHDSAMFVEPCLGSIATAVESLGDYLEFWSDAMDRSSVARMRTAQFLCEEWCFANHHWPFWEEIPDQRQQLISWLRRNDTAKRINRALTQWFEMPEGSGYGYFLGDYERWRVQCQT